MQATAHTSQLGFGRSPWSRPAPQSRDFSRTDQTSPLAESRLSIRVLKTVEDRLAIAELRVLAAFGVERDLGLELAPLEEARDEVGMVTAISLDQRLIATTRFVPTGYGLTAAERLQKIYSVGTQQFGAHSWEVGRIIMEPEERNPALLLVCLGLALMELLKQEAPHHLHASTTLSMARLWRRFGMKTAATVPGMSGERYALVEGNVEEIAAVLGVPFSRRGENTVPEELKFDHFKATASMETARFSKRSAEQRA